MKKLPIFMAYILAILSLAALGYWGGIVPHFDMPSIGIYLLCLLVVPFFGNIALSPFAKCLCKILFTLLLCGGIIGGSSLLRIFGVWSDLPLFIAALLFCILHITNRVSFASPTGTHLVRRGMTVSHARRFLYTRENYAYFFQNTAALMSFITFWRLFGTVMNSTEVLFGFVFQVVLFGFFGFLLYWMLGAPQKALDSPHFSTARTVWIFIFLFALFLSCAYIFVGYRYLPTDPMFLNSLSFARHIMTDAFLGSIGGFIVGALFGLFFHFIGHHLFTFLLNTILCVPLYGLFMLSVRFLPFSVALGVPIGFAAMQSMLDCLKKAQALRPLPLKKYGKSVLTPLVFLPLIGQLFKSIFIGISLSAFFSVWQNMQPDYLSASVLCTVAALVFSLYQIVKGALTHV